MQEINWGNNKELKSAFTVNRLETMNAQCINLLKMALVAYGFVVFEAWCNSKSSKLFLYLYVALSSLYIMKNLLLIG